MKALKFILAGLVFGIILTKGQVVSWFRIYEMFKFQAFHMYGVIGSAVFLGVVGHLIIKKFRSSDIDGQEIKFKDKDRGVVRYLIGGTIFGLGWALTGACPGPLFAQIGNGISVFIVVVLSAVLGTFVYGLIRNKLPH